MGQPRCLVETCDFEPRDFVTTEVKMKKGGHSLDILPTVDAKDVDTGVEVSQVNQPSWKLC